MLAYVTTDQRQAEAWRDLFASLRGWAEGGTLRHVDIVEHPEGGTYALPVTEHTEQWRAEAREADDPRGTVEASARAVLKGEKINGVPRDPMRVAVTEDDVSALAALPEPVELGADWFPEPEDV